MSRALIRTRLTPNAITAITMVVGLIGSAMIATGSWFWLALGGVLHQLASITDGVDGEIARLKLQMSHRGEWFDTLADDVRSISLIAALGVGSFALSGSSWLVPATVLATAATTALIGQRYIHLVRIGAATHNVFSVNQVTEPGATLWREVKHLFSYIVKRDTHTLLFMGCLAANLPQAAFAMMTFGIVTMLIRQTRFTFDNYVRVRALPAGTGEHSLVESQG